MKTPNKFKALGELDESQQKKLWDTTLSGSQIGRIFTEPEILVKEKLGLKEPIDLSKIYGVQEKLHYGTILEDFIIKEAIERSKPDNQFYEKSYEVFKEAQFDKTTFQSTNFLNRTANIDGYIGKSIDDMDYIIEVKNSVREIEDLFKTYQWQIRYYMWFFNVKKGAYLLYFKSGCKLEKYYIKRDMEIETFMLDKIAEIEENIKNKTIPAVKFENEKKLKISNLEVQAVVKNFIKYKQLEAYYKKQKTAQSLSIDEIMSQIEFDKKAYIYMPNIAIEATKITRKGSVNWREIAETLASKHGEDIMDITSHNTKEPSTYITYKEINLEKGE